MGIQARTDRAVGAVEAVVAGPAPMVQPALLRPHRGRLRWWLDCGAEPTLPLPYCAPLTPAARPADAACRIAGLLRTQRA